MIQLLKKGLISLLAAILVLATVNGCKDDYESTVPYVPVNFSLNPTNFIELNIPGGSIYLPNQGNGGIIVFRDLVDSPNPFLAFDATCTYELSIDCRVTVPDVTGQGKCPCCGSEYILFGGNGNPFKGPAVEPLKQYRTNYAGGLISIRN